MDGGIELPVHESQIQAEVQATVGLVGREAKEIHHFRIGQAHFPRPLVLESVLSVAKRYGKTRKNWPSFQASFGLPMWNATDPADVSQQGCQIGHNR